MTAWPEEKEKARRSLSSIRRRAKTGGCGDTQVDAKRLSSGNLSFRLVLFRVDATVGFSNLRGEETIVGTECLPSAIPKPSEAPRILRLISGV